MSILKIKRLEKGLTLRKTAELIGMSPSFLSELENGKRNLPKNIEKIKNIQIVLDIPGWAMTDVELSLKLSKIVHDKCKGVPHDIGMWLSREVYKHYKIRL